MRFEALSTLEKVNGSYVTDDLRSREDDVIWRVRFKDRWLYLYILLEFQSSVDAQMALRVMTYLGLLYQDILRKGQQPAGQKLPLVLPIVLPHQAATRNEARRNSGAKSAPFGQTTVLSSG